MDLPFVFKRKIYDKMLQWKHESKGRSALLIEGARRIGKSTIAQQFAKTEYKSHIVVDFSNASAEIHNLFKDISNLDYFFFRLKLLCGGVELYERQSVIIFDEVQLQPLARQAIKHLVADGRYDYIETGSLISIQQNVQDILLPSEEESICMYPMDYEEFRWALGDYATMGMLRELLSLKKPLGDDVNRKLMRDFRLYILVGGMPQAVASYLTENDLCKVDKVKRNIIKLYANDFIKIDRTQKAKNMLMAIPSQLHKNATRFQASTIVENLKQSKAQELVAIIKDSMTANVAYRLNDPAVGFAMTEDSSSYKMYLCDTGLFVTLAFWDKEFSENTIYQKLLSDKLDANLGYVYENMVAQMLVASGHKLYYNAFCDDNNHRYEIDFILSRGNKIVPIEVKSSGYRTHASLDRFCAKYSNRIQSKYLIYTKDFHCEGDVQMIPVYMTGLL